MVDTSSLKSAVMKYYFNFKTYSFKNIIHINYPEKSTLLKKVFVISLHWSIVYKLMEWIEIILSYNITSGMIIFRWYLELQPSVD